MGSSYLILRFLESFSIIIAHTFWVIMQNFDSTRDVTTTFFILLLHWMDTAFRLLEFLWDKKICKGHEIWNRVELMFSIFPNPFFWVQWVYLISEDKRLFKSYLIPSTQLRCLNLLWFRIQNFLLKYTWENCGSYKVIGLGSFFGLWCIWNSFSVFWVTERM